MGFYDGTDPVVIARIGQQNAVLGASAMLSGYCRLTYSLTVVMLETTKSIQLFIPMLICMTSAYGTGLIFNYSLYNRALRGKQVPMLGSRVPKCNKEVRAKMIMVENPYSLTSVPTVNEIAGAVKKGLRMFPVLY
jgi:chloride channel 7